MEIAYFVVGGLLMLISLFVIAWLVFLYFDVDSDEERGEAAKYALLSLLLPMLVVLWPITLPIAIIGGLIWLVRDMFKSIKTLDNQRTGR